MEKCSLFVAIDKMAKLKRLKMEPVDRNGKYYELHDFDGVVDSYNSHNC
jgi:hypothetical protein